MKNDTKAAEPMDPTAREGASPERVVREVRQAYALDRLIEEVSAAFGVEAVVYGEPDKFQVIHEVTFPSEDPLLAAVLADVAEQDSRILGTGLLDGLEGIYVMIASDRRTRDDASGFGVGAVLEVHNEDNPDAPEPVVESTRKVAQARKPRAPRKTAAKKSPS